VPRLGVVVPVYNNADDLPELADRLRAAAGEAGLDLHLVFVDDGSADPSFAVLTRLAAADSTLTALRLSRNFGSNAAIMAGLLHVRGEAVCVIAADLQDPPELIPEMARHWSAGAEVVLAARQGRDDPPVTRLFATIFNRLFRSLVFRDFPRDGFDFVLLDRRVVAGLIAMPEKHSYLYGQIMWLGFRRAIVHYARQKRRSGRSGWTLSRKLKYFIDAFTAFSYLPVRLASAAGFLLAFLGFAYALAVIVVRLRGGIPERGFSALMVVLLVVSGTQLVVTGIMGEYLWRILEEVRPRPPFVIAGVLNAEAPRAAESVRPMAEAAR
jgi:polyisoprenyl-phosphate glycosyltransferase